MQDWRAKRERTRELIRRQQQQQRTHNGSAALGPSKFDDIIEVLVPTLKGVGANGNVDAAGTSIQEDEQNVDSASGAEPGRVKISSNAPPVIRDASSSDPEIAEEISEPVRAEESHPSTTYFDAVSGRTNATSSQSNLPLQPAVPAASSTNHNLVLTPPAVVHHHAFDIQIEKFKSMSGK